jgi:hypothetical protein
MLNTRISTLMGAFSGFAISKYFSYSLAFLVITRRSISLEYSGA